MLGWMTLEKAAFNGNNIYEGEVQMPGIDENKLENAKR
jgi:hypothetical protein